MKDMSEEYWRKKLTPEEYKVLRQKHNEYAFTGAYFDKKDPGVYKCVGCGTPLFSSAAKYDSGRGWPSFWEAIDDNKIELHPDDSFDMHRTEVTCATCGGHLGHLFDDGPQPTGQRYCLSSVALAFDPKAYKKAK